MIDSIVDELGVLPTNILPSLITCPTVAALLVLANVWAVLGTLSGQILETPVSVEVKLSGNQGCRSDEAQHYRVGRRGSSPQDDLETHCQD